MMVLGGGAVSYERGTPVGSGVWASRMQAQTPREAGKTIPGTGSTDRNHRGGLARGSRLRVWGWGFRFQRSEFWVSGYVCRG